MPLSSPQMLPRLAFITGSAWRQRSARFRRRLAAFWPLVAAFLADGGRPSWRSAHVGQLLFELDLFFLGHRVPCRCDRAACRALPGIRRASPARGAPAGKPISCRQLVDDWPRRAARARPRPEAQDQWPIEFVD